MARESVFEKTEKDRNYNELIGSEYFYGDSAKGVYRMPDGRVVHPRFILQDYRNNVFRPILNEAVDYLSEAKNNIKWWGCPACGDDGSLPSRHLLSSQVACINHLFPLRNDSDAVLKIAQAIDPDITNVVLLENDVKGTRGYISFEVVSKEDHLNEDFRHIGNLDRGEMCTSIDAIIVGIKKEKRILLAIEWKYTESYDDTDKSKEDGNHPKGSMGSGNTRLKWYSSLILNSKQIVHPATDNLRGTVYFFEPFYQLMRQTLWAEQMILHKDTEIIKADDYIHVHVIPSANHDLLDKVYPVSGKRMEETWRSCIMDQNKYRIISPKDLLAGVNRAEYEKLIDFLQNRYWNCDK